MPKNTLLSLRQVNRLHPNIDLAFPNMLCTLTLSKECVAAFAVRLSYQMIGTVLLYRVTDSSRNRAEILLTMSNPARRTVAPVIA
jgi:hypothetical protein